MYYWVINRVATRPLFDRRRRGKRVECARRFPKRFMKTSRQTLNVVPLSLSLSRTSGKHVNIYYFENSPVDSINQKSVYTSRTRLYGNGPSIFLNYPRGIRSRVKRGLDHRLSVCDPCGGVLYDRFDSIR